MTNKNDHAHPAFPYLLPAGTRLHHAYDGEVLEDTLVYGPHAIVPVKVLFNNKKTKWKPGSHSQSFTIISYPAGFTQVLDGWNPEKMGDYWYSTRIGDKKWVIGEGLEYDSIYGWLAAPVGEESFPFCKYRRYLWSLHPKTPQEIQPKEKTTEIEKLKEELKKVERDWEKDLSRVRQVLGDDKFIAYAQGCILEMAMDNESTEGVIENIQIIQCFSRFFLKELGQSVEE